MAVVAPNYFFSEKMNFTQIYVFLENQMKNVYQNSSFEEVEEFRDFFRKANPPVYR